MSYGYNAVYTFAEITKWAQLLDDLRGKVRFAEYSSSSIQPKESELTLEGESFERTDFLLHFLWTHCFISKTVSMAKHRLQESPLPPAAPPTHAYICIHTSSSAVCSHQAASQNASWNFTDCPQKRHLFVASAVILRLMFFCWWWCCYFVEIEKIIKTKKKCRDLLCFQWFQKFLVF